MDKEKRPIKDNPSTKKLQEEMDGMSALLSVAKLFGFKPPKDLPDIKKLKRELSNLSKLPDEFNEAFGSKGWIAYESFNVPVMQKAVDLFNNGDEKAAEDEIIAYYNVDNIRMMIVGRGSSVDAYRPRKQMALYALNEYEAKRYYSCVPLLLMIIDGVVNDISKEAGFFAEKTDVTSWDSIAGHYTGLTQLKNIYNKSRKKTNTEEIFMPYRNGILHGRDLNYNNIYVAAKCWCCLAAVLDWGRDVANGKKEAPPPEPPKTLSETLHELKDTLVSYNDTEEFKKRIEKWQARDIKIDFEKTKNILSTDLKKFSPERAIIEFVNLWQKDNYGHMANYIYSISKSEQKSSIIKTMRRIFEHKKLLDYKIIKIEDKAPVITHVTLELTIEYENNIIIKTVEFRMIYEGDKVINGDEGGQWKLINGYCDLEFLNN